MTRACASAKRFLGKATRFGAPFLFALGLGGCQTLPMPKYTHYEPPNDKNIFEDDPPASRPFEEIKLVRTKVNFPSFHPEHDDEELCQNYYHKAVKDLLSRAEDIDGDAVIRVRSVVFLINGKHELHKGAECADDGGEGQILVQGMAIRWKKKP